MTHLASEAELDISHRDIVLRVAAGTSVLKGKTKSQKIDSESFSDHGLAGSFKAGPSSLRCTVPKNDWP